ncbi:MAG: Trehalose synthase [Methanomassiliicoccales archaeon PtaU1.Bin124]|nr:MAG: Trehalose synthase [Methanomassiliicoccales archaeon PtaU1.Bin124]
MRLLLMNWRDPKNPDAGGAEQFTHQILKRVVARGHDVTQVSAGFAGCLPEEVVDGVRFIRVGSKLSVYREAKKYYRNTTDRYDVIVDEINTIPFKVPFYANRGEKVYALIHQLAREFWYYETPFPVNVIGHNILEDRWIRKYADVPVITVSKSTYDDLKALGLNNVRIIHEGYDHEPLAKVPAKEQIPTVIFVGRFKKAKKPQEALDAFVLAKEKMPELQLWMVGDGYIRKELEERGVKDAKFWGRLPLAEKNSLISRAHLLIVPAVREGWGLVVTESNAMGTPALGYNVGGLRDSIKNGETGWLSDPDPRSMADGIVEAFSDRQRLAQFTERALEDSRQYSWERSTDEFLSIITEK